MGLFTSKNGTIGLYDNSGTKWKLFVKFEMGNFSGPVGRQRHAENFVTHRGRLGDSSGYTSAPVYVAGPDDIIAEPINISFDGRIIDSEPKKVFSFMSCAVLPGITSSMASTKGSSSLTYIDAMSGSSATATTPAFTDTNKKCVDLYIRWATSAGAFMMAYRECYFPPDQMQISEGDESGITIAFAGLCYGAISQYDDGASFPAGDDAVVYDGSD